MILHSRRHQCRKGTAAVEFAVVMLFIVPLLIGLWEVGRLVEVEQILNSAVREAGRQASTGNKNTAAVQQTVVSYCAANGITVATTDVTVTNVTDSMRNDPTTAKQMDQFRVDVKIGFDSVRWILLNKISTTQNLTATINFYSMRDVPLVVNATIPVN